MAYDVHIGLGWDWHDREKVTDCFGLGFLIGDDYQDDRDEFETSNPETLKYPFDETQFRNGANTVPDVQEVIRQVWLKVIGEMAREYNWTAAPIGTYTPYLTRLGLREFKAPTLAIMLDRQECDQKTEDTLFGICLTSRYFPTLLDWREPHGGLVTLKPDNLQWLERFQSLLSEPYPEFQNAYLVFPEMFY